MRISIPSIEDLSLPFALRVQCLIALLQALRLEMLLNLGQEFIHPFGDNLGNEEVRLCSNPVVPGVLGHCLRTNNERHNLRRIGCGS